MLLLTGERLITRYNSMCTGKKTTIHVFTFNNIHSLSIKKHRSVTCHDSLNKMMANK